MSRKPQPHPLPDIDPTDQSSTSLAVINVPVIVPVPTSLQGWADRITHATGHAVEAILDVGRLLLAAKKALRHGEWERLFKGHPQAVAQPVRFSVATAKMYMKIAMHPVLSNRNLGNDLPPSWRTLYELTHLPVDELEAHLALGTVHPELTRAEAIVLQGPPMPLPKGKGSRARPPQRDYEGMCRVEILQEDEVRLRQYATEVAAELRAPLRFSEAGRIVSGVWWLSLVPSRTVSRPPVHRCQCPTCGHTHAAQRAR